MNIRTGLIALAASLVATAAVAQDTTMGALLADGFEIKAMTAADLEPGDGAAAEEIFIVVQKENEAFGCIMQSIDTSICQRIQ